MSDQKNIKTLIIEKRRRLQKLKEQEARYGFSVEPSVLLEIEDIEAELEDLQLQLKALEAVAESPALESDSLASPSGEAITATVDENREYFSCFISYSHKDEAFAERLYADLQDKGVPCWYAPEDLRIGDKIRPRIDESIRQFDKLLLVLSEHSIDSLWVEHEVEAAFEKEMKHNTIMLFPIRLGRRYSPHPPHRRFQPVDRACCLSKGLQALAEGFEGGGVITGCPWRISFTNSTPSVNTSSRSDHYSLSRSNFQT